MKNITLIIIAWVSPLLLFSQPPADASVASIFQDKLDQILADRNVPGTAIAIIQNGEIQYQDYLGMADKENNKPVSASTGFNIGSISKTFTAWGIMKLVEQGKLSLNDPVAKHLSRWKIPESEFDESKITISMLLSHTAGLSVHGYDGFDDPKQLPSLVGSLNGEGFAEDKVEVIMEPGTKWQYSGGGYSILQLVVEEVTGSSFSDYMQKEVFDPLEMNSTSFKINRNILKASAKAYDEEAREIPLKRFTAQAAAGLHTNLEDMTKFVFASFKDNAVISKNSISALIQPTEISKGNYGMAYMIMNRFGDFTLRGHGGSNDGWEAGMMLDFSTNSGFIMLTNSSNGKSAIFDCLGLWTGWYKTQL